MSRGVLNNKCPGSGTVLALDWLPDNKSTEEFPHGYPGAAVCQFCSGGVLVLKKGVYKGVNMAGYERYFGTLRVHKRFDE